MFKAIKEFFTGKKAAAEPVAEAPYKIEAPVVKAEGNVPLGGNTVSEVAAEPVKKTVKKSAGAKPRAAGNRKPAAKKPAAKKPTPTP